METMRPKLGKGRLKKSRPPGPRSASASATSLTAADEGAPDGGARRSVSEGPRSPEQPPPLPLPPPAARVLKKKHAKLAKRPGLERGRLALQQVKKRKKMKEKV
ncbi:uncharacterized protein LOC119104928 [Pollicipes pollicipes]|uniref:uncharacterized protein LOC119104543 n=1 Tax=Pollicipes pollicipes TaxID=41117 RepID=UPI0018856EC1|nr:uncharacterized protein LOC119104543 [Pollicipes pollicipes]XP_037084573.1 uncharacterized protein LOC119104928 [Pollicipes pollicipes]